MAVLAAAEGHPGRLAHFERQFRRDLAVGATANAVGAEILTDHTKSPPPGALSQRGILTRSACRPLQKIFDILTGGTHAAFTIILGKWRHVGRFGPAVAILAAALVVRARRRLGHRDRVGTGKGILKAKFQRFVELLLVA